MSAFFLGPTHINALLSMAQQLARSNPGGLAWCRGNTYVRLRDVDLTDLGKHLYQKNLESVRTHGLDTEDAERAATVEVYIHNDAGMPLHWPYDVIHGAIRCYQYQSSDTTDWPTSEAYAFTDAMLTLLLEAALPPPCWEITSVPAALASARKPNNDGQRRAAD